MGPSKIVNVSPESDALLLQRYNRGGADAMSEIFDRHAGSLYRVAFTYTGNVADAEDITQAAFLQLLRAAKMEEIRNLRGWLMKVVLDGCHQKTREQIRERENRSANLQTQATAPEADPANTEMIAAAMKAVQSLPKHYRLPVWLHFREGLSFIEVAKVLSLPHDTVRKQASRGIERVRESLATAGFSVGSLAISELLVSATLVSAPITLAGSVKAAVANAAANSGGVATLTAARAGIGGTCSLLGLKISAGVVFTFLAAVGSYQVFSDGPLKDPPADAPDEDETPGETKKEDMPNIVITPRGGSVSDALAQISSKDLRVAILGSRKLLVPSEMRSKPIAIRDLVEAMAMQHGLQIVKLDGGRLVVLQHGAPDANVERLLADLKSPDAAIRCEAAWRAGWTTDARVVLPLLAASEDADVETRRQVDLACGRLGLSAVAAIGGEKVLAVLQRMLQNRDSETRTNAASALGQIGGDKALILINKALKDWEASVRANALSGLKEYGAEALPLIEKSLNDNEPYVWRNAIMTLTKLPDGRERAKARLRARLNDENPFDRISAAATLGQFQDCEDEVIACFETLVANPDSNLRANAVWNLGKVGGDKAFTLLEKALGDKNQHVAGSAAGALGDIGGERAFGLLETALRNGEVTLRAEAARALGKMGSDEAVKLLEIALEDKDSNVRSNAFGALDSGGVKALQVFQKKCASEDPGWRGSALIRLGYLRREEPLDLFEAALKDKDEQVRIYAVSGLGYIGGEKAFAILEKALDDKQLRSSAIGSLGDIGGPKAFSLVAKFLKDENRSVRGSVAIALAKIGGQQVFPLIQNLVADDNAWVRQDAVRALGLLRGGMARDLLIQRLADEKEFIVLDSLKHVLKYEFENSPEAKKALADYELTAPPKANLKPQPDQPVPAGDF